MLLLAHNWLKEKEKYFSQQKKCYRSKNKCHMWRRNPINEWMSPHVIL